MDAAQREQRINLALALVLSAGLHLIGLLTLDPSPARWRHGLQPALRVVLKQVAAAPVGAAQLAAEVPFDVAPDAAPRRADASARAGAADGAPAAFAQPGAGMPLADRYFRRSEVDVVAEPLERGPLVYPEHAFVSRLPGKVRARVYISETGAVDAVEIVDAQPPGHFEQAALEALRQVRYRPAEIAGRPVKSQKLIEVTFNPYEPGASRSARAAA